MSEFKICWPLCLFCFVFSTDDFDMKKKKIYVAAYSEKQTICQICLCSSEKNLELKQFICTKWKTFVVNLEGRAQVIGLDKQIHKLESIGPKKLI